jgi:acyl carrier protein
MTREALFEQLNSIFRDVFDDETITITEATTADDIEDWDSLEHINLILAIEQTFDMKFSISEVTGTKNVGEMADVIISKVAK